MALGRRQMGKTFEISMTFQCKLDHFNFGRCHPVETQLYKLLHSREENALFLE